MPFKKRFIKIDAPKLPKEIEEKASQINRQMTYDNDVMLLNKIRQNNLFYFPARFSTYIALRDSKQHKTKPAVAVAGLIETDEGFVLTKEAKKPFNKEHGKYDVSVKGLANVPAIPANPVISNLKKELYEELLLHLDELHLKKFFEAEFPNHYIFGAIFKTELPFKEIKKRAKNAKDSWEIEELKLADKKELLKMKNTSKLLKAFSRMVK